MDKTIFDTLRQEQKLNVGRTVNALRQYEAVRDQLDKARDEYETLLVQLRMSGVSIRSIAALIDRPRNHVARHTDHFMDPKNARVRIAAQRRGRQQRRRGRVA